MNQRRLQISEKLKLVLGNTNTYFQPPENIKMRYPCAVYDLDGVNAKHANDRVYLNWNRYVVTFISKDPDNDYYDKMVEQFPKVRFDRRYKADGMYHDVYTIY